MFATAEITHPVTLGGASTRGMVDSAGQMVPLAGAQVQFTGTVLYVEKDALPGLEDGAVISLGELGALDMTGAKTKKLGRTQPIDDGLIIACELGSGR
jgi:hypothetical protein